ncbi:hypothetical protein HKX48_006599 [Thoreauomyces humboldtii]|nr:hypothetical protein HKX48_006599 [Thoreauomyces humboldtii]
MANINIRRDVSDKFYRYKMPRLISKIEGKGNGIKTVVPNMSDIAKALARPATYPTKYFGCELGAQARCEEKNDRYVINGAHDAEKLQGHLDGFINRFVLCGSCKNPETELVITKNGYIIRDCKACGANTDVEMTHKLTTFILKNPPAQSKKSKKGKNGVADKNAPTPPDTASNGSDNDDETAQVAAFMDAEAAAAAQLQSREIGEDDDDWAVDTSADAVAARMKELAVGGAVAKLEEADDDDESDDPLEQFADYIQTHADATDAEIQTAARNLDIRSDKAVAVLSQVLFDADVLSGKQIPSRAALLRKFCRNDKAQRNLLGGIERLVGVSFKEELMPKVAMIFKVLYDEDLVDEEVFAAWGEKPSKKFVDRKIAKEIREKAEPFLAWLKEADEAESSDEEDEEEDGDEEEEEEED